MKSYFYYNDWGEKIHICYESMFLLHNIQQNYIFVAYICFSPHTLQQKCNFIVGLYNWNILSWKRYFKKLVKKHI